MNHLIIGLGGTGGKVVRALRKAIYQEYKDARPGGVALEYLYVDSSNEFMKPDDPTWRVLGKSVQLEPKQQLLITGANLASVLDNLDNYPGIKGWIGNRSTWSEILNSIVGDTLGGQKRRLGRFLLACKASELRGKLEGLTHDLVEASGQSDVTFHVCCGLAGGTGSGTVVDVVSQIRDMFPEPRRYRILVYALLPEANPPRNWNSGNYHANGYAALLELNALSVGKYKPYDITGRRGRLELSDPFNGCYVFTTQNEGGVTLDTDKDVPAILADFLYHKVVAAQAMSWPTLAKAENAENGDGSPECAPYSNDPARSKRFLAFGLKRLAIPVDEIREYVAYHFAKASLLQMLFNHWSDAAGFLDVPRAFDAATYSIDKANLEQWNLTDAHFTLSAGVLETEMRWRPHSVDWQEFSGAASQLAQQRDKKEWLPELARLFKTRFDEQYRGLGVSTLFASKTKARREHARAVRARLEEHLFTEWLGGRIGLSDVLNVLNAILGGLSDRLARIDEQIVKGRETTQKCVERAQANNATWARAGILSLAIGAAEKLLAAQTAALTELYTSMTEVEGLLFAKQLLDVLVAEEVQELRNDVSTMLSALTKALQQVDDSIASRCADEGKTATLRPLVRYYNPAEVRELSTLLYRDQDIQVGQVAEVRSALEKAAAGRREFANLTEKFAGRGLLDLLEPKAMEAAKVAQDEMYNRRPGTRRLLDDDIIARLQADFGSSDEALRSYLAQLVDKASSYLAFDGGEKTKQGPGVPEGSVTAVESFSVLLPSSQNIGYLGTVFDAIRAGYKGTGSVDRIPTDGKRKNELVLVSLKNLFPLRYSSQVAKLKSEYESRIARAESGRVALEVHTEGEASTYPSLFLPSRANQVEKFLPTLLLARAVGIVKADPSGELEFVTVDDYGLETAESLGGNLLTVGESVSGKAMQEIDSAVGAALSRMTGAERETWMASVRAEIEAVKALLGGDMKDARYKTFVDAARSAMDRVRAQK